MSPFLQELESIASTVVVDGFKAAIASLPVLESILSEIASKIGPENIKWATLLEVVLNALPGGPVAVLITILTSLSTILVTPSATALAAARVLLELHTIHAF